MLGTPGEPCAACGDPLASDQRYCLNCGERRGPPRLDPVAMARGPAAVQAAAAAGPGRSTRWPGLPSARISGAAALLVLAFGIAAGTVAGPRAGETLASGSAQRRLIIVARAPAPAPAPKRTAPSTTPAQTPSTSTPAPSHPSQPTPTNDHSSSSTPAAPPAPKVKHVWIVALTGHWMSDALASPSPMPYLSGTLQPKGLLLTGYRAVVPGALANLLVMLSGLQPTTQQMLGCPQYIDVDPKTHAGCIWGKDVKTLPEQLTDAGHTWRGYVEDADVAQPPDTCRHPALGGPLEPVMARDPFLFFHAIVDSPDCGADVAGISRLAPDAADPASAPDVSVVIPDACHDGADQPCAPGAPAGLPAADAWLKTTLEPLLASKSYEDKGLVVVTFDAGPDQSKPVGALLLSPAVKAGATDDGRYSHSDLLRSIEDLFSFDHLGAATWHHGLPVTNPSP